MLLHNNRRLFACLALVPALLATTLALVSSSSSVAQTTDTAARLHGQLEAIVAGKDSAERGAAITRQLEKLEVKVRMQPFEKVDTAEMEKALPAVEQIIRQFDKSVP